MVMIDWGQLRDLWSELGPEEFPKVLELFLDEVEGTTLRLSKVDAQRLSRDMHYLKGSALNLGFTDFAQLCSRNEVLATQGALDRIDIEALTDLYARSKRHLFSEMKTALGVRIGAA